MGRRAGVRRSHNTCSIRPWPGPGLRGPAWFGHGGRSPFAVVDGHDLDAGAYGGGVEHYGLDGRGRLAVLNVGDHALAEADRLGDLALADLSLLAQPHQFLNDLVDRHLWRRRRVAICKGAHVSAPFRSEIRSLTLIAHITPARADELLGWLFIRLTG